MPIYAYKCSACGHSKDVLQKISDLPLHTCPVCGAEAFSKQITAAGFQLKGAGWYVTDFRAGGDGANSGVGKPAESTPDTGKAEASKTDAAKTPTISPAPATAASAPTSTTSNATKSVAAPADSTPAKA
jgi:putative FmdB family regulatory protein